MTTVNRIIMSAGFGATCGLIANTAIRETSSGLAKFQCILPLLYNGIQSPTETPAACLAKALKEDFYYAVNFAVIGAVIGLAIGIFLNYRQSQQHLAIIQLNPPA
jgi:ABC-type phosphate transport system permease subunit